MKTPYTLIMMVILSLNSFAQECVDFSKITATGWIIESGTIIYEGEKISLQAGGSFDFMGATGGQLNFYGYLDIYLNSDCPEKTLEFNGFNGQVGVDGDTIDTEDPFFSFPYVTSNYVLNFDGATGIYTLEGAFDEIVLGYSTNIINQICLTESCTGLSATKISESGFAVYPNPASNVLNVDTEYENLEIFNILGEVVLSSHIPNMSVDVSGINTGTYFIKLTNKGEVAVTKFVKK